MVHLMEVHNSIETIIAFDNEAREHGSRRVRLAKQG